MAISKIIYKSSASATPETWMDVTSNTSESANMLSGVVGTKADGTSATGNIANKSSSDLTVSGLTVTAPAGHYASNATKTLTDANLTAGNIKKDVEIFGVAGSYEGSSGTLVTKTITANGTYNASSDNADGYSSVMVNVPQPAVTYTETPGPNGSTIVNINTIEISNKADVNFIDYDGTLVATKTKAEIDAMTSDSDLPANPSHAGLTSQGWNWTVAQLKTQLTAMPDQKIWVGQMYITASGATEIDVIMQEGRLSPIMTIAVNGEVSIDWGDGTTPDTVTGTSTSTSLDAPHTYASAGSYTIKISSVSGTYSFYGGSSYTLLRKNETATQNRVYSNCIQHIRLGSGITSIGDFAFYNCNSLASITIPSSVTSIGTYAFQNCYSLASVTIPSGVASIGVYAFYYCYSIASITIPSSVTSIKGYVFYGCYSLASITIPSSVTSIGGYAFYGCSSLASITIPSSVTSIGGSTFNSCYGMAEYHLKRTTPPTLSNTSTFNNIPSDCIIYVPRSENQAVLNSYKTAQNWSDYASYIQEEVQ